MLKAFKRHIAANFLNLKSNKFILACSGGVDSVVLVHLCKAAKLPFVVAHCNFNLRGEESDLDEHFVIKLAADLGFKIYTTSFNTVDYMQKNKVNVQVAARELRYAWFTELMQKYGIGTLVTAHHADDNLETFLINLSRGTGIEGLTGIPEKTNTISRPLLPFSRAQIVKFAKSENLKWRDDRSNAETKYLRNKIRHNIVPLLKELHPTFLENFQMTQLHLRDSSKIAKHHLKELKTKYFEVTDTGFRISVQVLAGLHPQKGYLYALLKDYGFTAWDDVLRLLNGSSGKEIYSKTHRLLKDRAYLLLEEVGAPKDESFLIEKEEISITTPLTIHISKATEIKEKGAHILYVDKDTLKYPLVVRKWKKGDYFYPFGMTGKKKLSKYFKDEKINRFAKEKQWLLCSEDAIVWVIGRRPDQRFSVRPNTKQIITFTIQK